MVVQTVNKLGEMSFTVDDYYKMIELGILPEDSRTQIIGGKLIEVMPIGSRHASVVEILNRFFIRNFEDEFLVRTQNPARLNDYDEPQPDLALVKFRKDFYRGHHPTAEDVLLIIEVADSTLKFDRETKIPLYAAAEIPEIWLINIKRNLIIIHTKPINGEYQNSRIVRRKETLQSETVPNISIEVDKILG